MYDFRLDKKKNKSPMFDGSAAKYTLWNSYENSPTFFPRIVTDL